MEQLNIFSQKVESKDKKSIHKFPFESATKSVENLAKGGRLIGLTRGQFSLIDLITSVLNITGKADVICCTWSAGIKDSKQMKSLQNNGNINSFKIVTDHSYATRQKQYAISLTELFGEENIATTEIHAKFTLIKNDDWNICIRTSMNLNANKTCENFEIDDDIEIYSFYEEFLRGVFTNMPKGFTSSSNIVNNALNKVFKKEQVVNNVENKYIW